VNARPCRHQERSTVTRLANPGDCEHCNP